jgi:signal transduction histidine kinase
MLFLVILLTGTGIYTVRLYRETLLFVENIARDELPLATKLCSQVSLLRSLLSELKGLQRDRGPGFLLAGKTDFGLGDSLRFQLDQMYRIQDQYSKILGQELENKEKRSKNRTAQWNTLFEIKIKIHELDRMVGKSQIDLNNPDFINELGRILGQLQILTDQMPEYLQSQFLGYSGDMKAKYRLLLITATTSATASFLILMMLTRLSYIWVFRPLRELLAGSRMVAQGRYNVRIKLDAQDEMKELADALNQMTEQFESVRNDLDQQVRVRTQEAVRTERLASVGFLAAGVAHEINNPLASIAMCAESLERRLVPSAERSETKENPSGTAAETEIIQRYLNMIQEEAFRCKGITEKLLDFARMERKSREWTDLSGLVSGVVEMLNHLGKYRTKQIRLDIAGELSAVVNPQEMKQVTLNLLTNALDSVEEGGTVWIRLFRQNEMFHLVVEDNGCGMDSEILKNVFEPFFTKRRNGQGTGLGLSITHRIVTEHQGRIEAYSAGSGKGAVFQVEIPISSPEAKKLAASKSKELVGIR